MGLCLIGFLDWLTPANCLAFVVGLAALGLVIFVHELGHFAVAKMCGVKCEKFYIGFDPPIRIGSIQLPSALWKRKWGETEYGIGIIPLGGYVKMLGQDDNPGKAAEAAAATQIASPTGPPKLDPRSYPAKSVPQRMAIISAGVTMNVIFAFFCALLAVFLGVKYVPCVVDHPTPGDPYWRAGGQPRDVIKEINGLKNPRFEDLQMQIVLANSEAGIKLVIERPGEKDDIRLTLRPDKDYFGPKNTPRLGVVMENATQLQEGMAVIPSSPAAKLPKGKAFEPGDKLISIDGRPIKDSVDYSEILAAHPDKPLEFVVERKDKNQPQAPPQRVAMTVQPNPWSDLGMAMTMGPIIAVQQGSPAARATSPKTDGGILAGDKIVAVNGKPVTDPVSLPMSLLPYYGKEVKITVARPVGSGSTQLEFTTTLDVPKYWLEQPIPDAPMALVPLGVTYNVTAKVAAIDPNGPAAKEKIAVGDEVTQVQIVSTGTNADYGDEAMKPSKPAPLGADGVSWGYLMSEAQMLPPNMRIKLTIKSGSQERVVEMAPAPSSTLFHPARGLMLAKNEMTLRVHSFKEATDFAWRETKGKLLIVYVFLRKMANGKMSPMSLSGLPRIATAAAMSVKGGAASLLLFLTAISANLAVVNFLPIPVLDGGHMVFLLLEGIFRRPVSERIVIPLTYAGLFLILSLVVLSVTMDVQWFASFF